MTTDHAPAPSQLVVVGCSWGGLRALQVLLADLPADFPGCMCIVQHRSALGDHRDRGYVYLLNERCAVQVCEADDKEPLRRGGVFVAPPDYHLYVDADSSGTGIAGHLALSQDERVQYSRPSIDVLFTSAADAFGEQVLGIVLTGANDDGAAGTRAIHAAGGMVLAQDPSEAERSEMPQAAVATGCVDEVLPLVAMGERIAQLCARKALDEHRS